MYRGRLWTMRQFAGFGRPRTPNARFHFLLEQGQTGLSTAFDMPTLMGYDADHPRARGEVGREGVAVSTLDDMARLFDGIPLEQVTTSMTVNCTASVLLAMYFAVAERAGRAVDRARRHDPERHAEGVHRAEGVDLPARALGAHRRRHDRVLHATRAALAPGVDQRLPHPRSRLDGGAGAGLHARRRHRLRPGRASSAASPSTHFAPRLSFFFNLHNDFLEEIAKLRAARRMWATIMRERFGATDPRSLLLRTHAQTAGVLADRAAAAQQRRARRDPGARRRARRRAVAAHELARRDARAADRAGRDGGAAHAADHRRGERRHQHRRPARRQLRRSRRSPIAWSARRCDYIQQIDELGGMVRAIELGFPQKEIADAGVPDAAPGRWRREGDGRREPLRAGGRAADPGSAAAEEVERDQVERVRAVKRGAERHRGRPRAARVADAAGTGRTSCRCSSPR